MAGNTLPTLPLLIDIASHICQTMPTFPSLFHRPILHRLTSLPDHAYIASPLWVADELSEAFELNAEELVFGLDLVRV